MTVIYWPRAISFFLLQGFVVQRFLGLPNEDHQARGIPRALQRTVAHMDTDGNNGGVDAIRHCLQFDPTWILTVVILKFIFFWRVSKGRAPSTTSAPKKASHVWQSSFMEVIGLSQNAAQSDSLPSPGIVADFKH